MCSLQHFYPQSYHLDIGLGFATQSSKFMYKGEIMTLPVTNYLVKGLCPLLHFSLQSTGLINYVAEEGASPPTTLFPSVNRPDPLWSGGGGFTPYYTFPFGQRA